MANDLRDWLGKVGALGKLREIRGADWDLEIGTATALNLQKSAPPVLLFDEIKGYPKGFRVVTCTGSTPSLMAVNLNLPITDSDMELLHVLRAKLSEWEAHLDTFIPETVSTGPVMQHVLSGNDVDLFRFPIPRWHALDKGRYVGTGDAVITRDPDTKEVNLGTYRLQAHDRNSAGWHVVPTQDGEIHRRKYHERGQACPVAVSIGHHPILLRVGSLDLPMGTEYRFAGAMTGAPIQVIEEEVTGLPIPADSEIVLAGFVRPDKQHVEGPFGEYTGYYVTGEQNRLVFDVERIYHRDDPILVGCPPDRPPDDSAYFLSVFRSAQMHNDLVKYGIPGVKGVWVPKETNASFLAIISLKQRYAGHAKQAALYAVNGIQGRYVVVVDDDIDPSNLGDVWWAICTRSDPEEDIDIIRDAPSVPLDPLIPKGSPVQSTRAIINACRPFGWIDTFPQTVDLDPASVEAVRSKWKDL